MGEEIWISETHGKAWVFIKNTHMRLCIGKESLIGLQAENQAAYLYLILRILAYTKSPPALFLSEILQKLDICMQNSTKTFFFCLLF